MSNDSTSNWITVETDEKSAVALAKGISVPLPIARLLVSRGFSDVASAESFMNPLLSNLGDPFELEGVQAASERIWKAIQSEEAITVFGDYDADGVTATALLVMVLRELGAKAESYLPNRHDEGYGLSTDAISSVIEQNSPGLLITVDCGTSSVKEVAFAVKNGVDVIITDHHECIGKPPSDAVAVVNPKLTGGDDTKTLAGVGVAFKLCHGIVKQGRKLKSEAVDDIDLRNYLDLVALGTVADVVPLIGENRILVRHGLAKINSTPRCGLQALIRAAGVRTKIDCYHLGFMIGPRINAAGRLASADLALRLLLEENPGKAKRLAGQLDSANRERKMIEDRIIEKAVEKVEAEFDEKSTAAIVSAGDGWHIGTIGIVAARLCGRYKRPAVVISFDEDGMGRGSCRSITSVNIIEALEKCSKLLEKCGGHKMAAGLSIKKENLAEFTECFHKACSEQINPADITDPHYIDSWITLGEADRRLLDAVDKLRPLGIGNQTPLWGAKNLSVVGRPKIVGKNHLKLLLANGGTEIDAIAFGMGDYEIGDGNLDAIFQVQENNYMGRKSIQLNIRDLRPSQ
jgi:single-stranded-DNA-specific exonuclease